MSIEALDPAQPEHLASFHALRLRAHPVDFPEEPAPTTADTRLLATRGWNAEPREGWLWRSDGEVVGAAILTLPHTENTHAAALDLQVDPACRRHGIGRGLLEHVAGRMRADGRRLVVVEAIDGRPGAAFAEAVGMQRALGEAMRRLDLTDDLRDRHRALLADAVKHADGYVLDGWTGPAPEDLLPAMADLLEAMNDAPMDELEWDDERMDPARVRRGEEYRAEMGWRTHRVVARHEVSGELAGLTEVAVHPEGWTHAYQLDTCVARAHRGHRLGLVLKLAMLQRLADLEPQLRVIDTWNAASNLHMIGVNEALGCRVVYTSAEWQFSVA